MTNKKINIFFYFLFFLFILIIVKSHFKNIDMYKV